MTEETWNFDTIYGTIVSVASMYAQSSEFLCIQHRRMGFCPIIDYLFSICCSLSNYFISIRIFLSRPLLFNYSWINFLFIRSSWLHWGLEHFCLHFLVSFPCRWHFWFFGQFSFFLLLIISLFFAITTRWRSLILLLRTARIA